MVIDSFFILFDTMMEKEGNDWVIRRAGVYIKIQNHFFFNFYKTIFLFLPRVFCVEFHFNFFRLCKNVFFVF